MHRNQIWWVWLLRFQKIFPFFVCLQNGQNFSSDHGLYHEGQKIESAQKIPVSRG